MPTFPCSARPGRTRAWRCVKGNADPVIIMGAGYDAAAEDATSPGATTMGNAVVVLDAMTGALLKSFATDRPVPASVALLDSDFDGYIDRAYAADLGANVYRLDFENALGDGSPSNWRIAKFASLGDGAGSRKFFYAPDLVQSRLFTARAARFRRSRKAARAVLSGRTRSPMTASTRCSTTERRRARADRRPSPNRR